MRGSSEELKGFCALTQRVCVVFVGMAGDAGSSQARALVQARSLSGRSGRLDGGLNPGSPIPGRLAPRSSFRGTLPALLSSPPRRRVVQEPQGSRPRASLSGDRVLPGYLLCLLGGESWALPFWYRLMAELALLSLCAPPPMRTRVGTLALEDPPVQGKLEAALRGSPPGTNSLRSGIPQDWLASVLCLLCLLPMTSPSLTVISTQPRS